MALRAAATLAHHRAAATSSIHSQFRATATATTAATEFRAAATTSTAGYNSQIDLGSSQIPAATDALIKFRPSSALGSSQIPAATEAIGKFPPSSALVSSQIPAATDAIGKFPPSSALGSSQIPAATGVLGKCPTTSAITSSQITAAAFGSRINGTALGSRIPATVLGSRGSAIHALNRAPLTANPVAVFRRMMANAGLPDPPPEVQAALRRLEQEWEQRYSKLQTEVSVLGSRINPDAVRELQNEICALRKDITRIESEAVQRHLTAQTDLSEVKAKMIEEYCLAREHKADSAFRVGTVAWRVCTTLLVFSLGTIVGVLQTVKTGWSSELKQSINTMVIELIKKMQIELEETLHKLIEEKVKVVNAELFVQSNEEIDDGPKNEDGGSTGPKNEDGGSTGPRNEGGGSTGPKNEGGGSTGPKK